MCLPWPTCTDDGCVGIRLAGDHRCLRHASAADRAHWFDGVAHGRPVDLRGVELDDVLLDGVLAAVPRDGEGGRRWLHARLDAVRVPFTDPSRVLDLSGAHFVGGLSLRSATIDRLLVLTSATIDDADFREARFARGCDLSAARISGSARFDEVTGSVVARNATFIGRADFRRARLDRLDVTGATFGGSLDRSLAEIGDFWPDGGGGGGGAPPTVPQRVLESGPATQRLRSDIPALPVTRVEAPEDLLRAWMETIDAELFGDPPEEETRPAPAPAWRPELAPMPLPDGNVRWVTVEEWVGFTRVRGPDGEHRRDGGVIGLVIDPWPVVDAAGRVAFPASDAEGAEFAVELDDGGVELVIEAGGLITVIRDQLEERTWWPRIGDVFGIAFRNPPERLTIPQPLGARALREIVLSVRDLTAHAREIGRTAFLATLAPPVIENSAADPAPFDGPTDGPEPPRATT